MKQKLVSFLIAFLASLGVAVAQVQGPVTCYGQLQASGNKIVGSNTGSTPVQVKGISLGWNCFTESSPFFKASMVDAMVDGWKAEVIRVPMTTTNVQGGHGTYSQGGTLEQMNDAVIQRAIEKGVYVIIDWHSHYAESSAEQANAIKYFTDMAKKWGGYDNVIFEIYNEPLGANAGNWNGSSTNTNWADIKTYANTMISTIRNVTAVDQNIAGITCYGAGQKVDNIILVGTRNFSQCLEEAMQSPIGDEDSKNVAYVFHFYAAAHKDGGTAQNAPDPNGAWNSMTSRIQKAMDAGKAVFVTEWGTVSNDGNGNHDESSSNTWMALLDQYKISSCAWQWGGKDEASAFFQQRDCSGCTPNASNYNQTQLTTLSNMSNSGKYIYNMLTSWAGTGANKAPWRQQGGCQACDPVTVTFDLNYSGAPVATTKPGCKGAPAQPIDAPARPGSGYSFKGWSLSSAEGSAIYPFTANLTGNITLYAQWELGGSTLVYDGSTDETTFCTGWYSMQDGSGVAKITGPRIPGAVGDEANALLSTATGGNPAGNMAITWNTDAQNATYSNWGAAIGFNFEASEAPVDMTGATGVSFDYKFTGPAAANLIIQIEVAGKGTYETKETPILTTAGSAFVTKEITFAELIRTVWGNGTTVPDVEHPFVDADLASITKMAFQFKTATAAMNGTFAVDNIQIMGVALQACQAVDPCDALADLIAAYQTECTAATEGDEPGQYPSPAKANFQSAITLAGNATGADCATATATLRAAYTTFKSKMIPLENNTLIADCEDGNLTKLQTYWSSFASGGATITPLSDETTEFTMLGTGKEGVASAQASGTLGITGEPDYSTAGIGFPLTPINAVQLPVTGQGVIQNPTECALDLTGAAGIGFWHKGDGVTFSVMLTSVTTNGGYDYQITVPESADWRYVIAAFPGESPDIAGITPAPLVLTLEQICGTWGAAGLAALRDWDASLAYKLQWQAKDGANGRTYNFSIDEVSIRGLIIPLETVKTTILDNLIIAATTLYSGASEGANPGNFAAGSKQILLQAINDAQLVADAAESQDAVDQAVIDLQEAIKTFKEGMVALPATLVFNAEDGALTKLGTYWYAFNDNDAPNNGSSITEPEGGAEFTMANGGYNSPKYARLDYALNAGVYDGKPFVGMGFALNAATTSHSIVGSTGISFWYKGDASRLKATMTGAGSDANLGYASYGYDIPAYTDWELITVEWSELTQPEWASESLPGGYDPSLAFEFQWQVEGATPASLATGWIGVDQVQIEGIDMGLVDPGLPLADNSLYGTAGEYQLKDTRYSTNDIKPDDKLNIVIGGTSPYAISGFQAVVVDNAAFLPGGDWDASLLSDYVPLGNITAGVAFNFNDYLTISGTAVAGSYTIVLSGSSPTAKAAGVDPLLLTLNLGDNFDEYEVNYIPFVADQYILLPSGDGDNRGAFARFPAGTRALVEGDVVTVKMEGTSSEFIDAGAFIVSVMDLCADAELEPYYTVLSSEFSNEEGGGWEYYNEDAIMAGTSFVLEFTMPIYKNSTGTCPDSQVIMLQDWQAGNPLKTTLSLPVFTAELDESTPTLDFTELESTILTAQGLAVPANSCENGGAYPADAVTDLANAITVAQGALTATEQPVINAAESDLLEAIADFEALEITRTTTTLASLIGTATTKYTNAIVGDGEGQYTAESKADFQIAIEAAQAVLDNKCLGQTAITNAATELQTAIDNFVPITLDKTQLSNLILSATNLQNTTTAGCADGMYPEALKLALGTAITAATAELNSSVSTPASIATAISNLQTAMTDLTDAEITVDRDNLTTLISTAAGIYNNAKTDGSDYSFPAAAKTQFNSDIQAAVAVNVPASCGEAVENAETALQTAIETFMDTQIRLNTGVLETAIQDAEALLPLTAGTEAGQYPQGAIDAFMGVLNDARDLVNLENNPTATQSDIDDMAQLLTGAIQALRAQQIPLNTTPLDQALQRANAANVGEGNGLYLPADAQTFAQAISDAEGVLITATTNDEIVQAALALDAAREAYLRSAQVMNDTDLVNRIGEAEQLLTDNADNIDDNLAGAYPQEAYEALEQAVSDARDALTNAANQGDIVDALTDLEGAMSDFASSVNPVNKAALIAILQQANNAINAPGVVQGEGDGQYLPAVYGALRAAINAGSLVNTNTAARQGEVDTAVVTIQTALDNFVPNDLEEALEELNDLITTAQNLHDGATEGEADGNYALGSRAIFLTAIGEARAVATAPGSSASDIAIAIGNLTTAIETFEDGKVDLDAALADLNELIQDAQQMYNAAEVGTGDGFYLESTMTMLDDAIQEAIRVAGDGSSTQAAITAVERVLETAMTNFTPESVDKDNLDDALGRAVTLYDPTEYGIEDCKYSPAIGDALALAIATGNRIYTDIQATQDSVDIAEGALETAITNRSNATPDCRDWTALETAITTAQSRLTGPPAPIEGPEFGQYTPGAIQDLTGALQVAQGVRGDATVAQSRIDAAAQALTQAIATFDAALNNIDKRDLLDALQEADAEYARVTAPNSGLIGDLDGQYPRTATIALNRAIGEARAVANNSSATQGQVNTAESNLRQALSDFAVAMVVVDRTLLGLALQDADNTIGAVTPQMIGEGNGQYSQSVYDAYATAIANAREEYERLRTSQQAINDQRDALVSAKALFLPNVVNLNDLYQLIQQVTDALVAANVCEYDECYSQESWNTLEAALTAATAIFEAPGSSQQQVNGALGNLQGALNTFVSSQIDVDFRALQDAIDNAQSRYDGTRVGTGVYECSQGAKDSLRDAIGEARIVRSNTQATQQQVDEATLALQEATLDFSNAIIQPVVGNKIALEVLYERARHLLQTTAEQSQGGNYVNGSRAPLITEMERAQLVLRDQNAIQEVIDDAYAELARAFRTYQSSTVRLETAPLQGLILDATARLALSDNNTGDGIGQYTRERVNALTSELEVAQSVLTSATTQAELVEAYANLFAVFVDFLPTPDPNVNNTALLALLYRVQSDIDNSSVYLPCMGREGYPLSALTAINMAFAPAKIQASQVGLTQEQVDRIYADLYAAYERYLESWTNDQDPQNNCTAVDVVEGSELRVYPTFATTNVTVAASKTIRSIAVVAINGATVVLEMPNNTQTTIDVTTLKQGNYTVVVTFDDNSVEQQSFIKK